MPEAYICTTWLAGWLIFYKGMVLSEVRKPILVFLFVNDDCHFGRSMGVVVWLWKRTPTIWSPFCRTNSKNCNTQVCSTADPSDCGYAFFSSWVSSSTKFHRRWYALSALFSVGSMKNSLGMAILCMVNSTEPTTKYTSYGFVIENKCKRSAYLRPNDAAFGGKLTNSSKTASALGQVRYFDSEQFNELNSGHFELVESSAITDILCYVLWLNSNNLLLRLSGRSCGSQTYSIMWVSRLY